MDYYLNCIADCDRHVERLLEELDALGLAENTIVIMTSDHGELGGAHGMHGQGIHRVPRTEPGSTVDPAPGAPGSVPARSVEP